MTFISSSECSFLFLKLGPGQDVRKELSTFCEKNKISAGAIISGVGSLKQVRLRKANSESFYEATEPHEVLTISGLISEAGVHIHLSIADQNARVYGGHLSEGNSVFTTLELVIANFDNIEFAREFDPSTGFKELAIHTLKSTKRLP